MGNATIRPNRPKIGLNRSVSVPEIDFIVRAALAEETNNGWVWLQSAPEKWIGTSPASRTIVTIEGPDRGPRIFVEVRVIDDNFRRKYNARPRIHIDPKRDTIVMAEWYRTALGICDTTKSDNETGKARLLVENARCQMLGSLRAACHHPDLVVRLGTRLGMLGTWLGVLGVWLGLIGVGVTQIAVVVFAIFVLALAAFGIWAGRGPLRPRRKEKPE